MKYTVTIPCYNSEKFLKQTVETLISEISKLSNDYEIILVNDGSKDNTFDVIRELALSNKNIIGINLVKNIGQHNAIIVGLNSGSGDIYINIDDDLQSNPKDIILLLKKMEETDCDVVYGNFIDKKYTFIKKFTSNLHNFVTSWMLEKKENWIASGFWVAKKEIVEQIKGYSSEYADMQSNFIRSTDKIVNQDVNHHDRIDGVSGYTLSKAMKLWSSTLNYTEKPGILLMKLSVILPLLTIFIMIILHFNNIEHIKFSTISLVILMSFIIFSLGYVSVLANRVLKIVAKVPFSKVKEKVGEK